MWRKVVTSGMFVAAVAVGPNALADVFSLPAGQVSLNLVPVGDAGNAADPLTGFGSVPYSYQMGQTDITVAMYTAMLNAVASSDPYNLYNPSMGPTVGIGTGAIVRSGSPGNYMYSFPAANSNFPINEVSWGDAARFCNWLANGQPATGVESPSTTEDGSYSLNGAVNDQQLGAVKRSSNATYVIPTENEWYKAAYYKGHSTIAGYWLYPTQSNTPPSNILSSTGTNNANFFDPVLGDTDPATMLTPVGAFADSPGADGTFDMGGDVFQWTESGSTSRVSFGGSYILGVTELEATSSFRAPASSYSADNGFRIAEVPEPSAPFLLTIGSLGFLSRRTGLYRGWRYSDVRSPSH